MNHRITSNHVNTMIALLTGAVIGGVVVALTTPKRGAELRKDLSRLGGKAKNQMGEWAEFASTAIESITTSGKERTDNATGPWKADAKEAADKGQKAWREIKKGTSNAGNDIKDGFTGAGKELFT